ERCVTDVIGDLPGHDDVQPRHGDRTAGSGDVRVGHETLVLTFEAVGTALACGTGWVRADIDRFQTRQTCRCIIFLHGVSNPAGHAGIVENQLTGTAPHSGAVHDGGDREADIGRLTSAPELDIDDFVKASDIICRLAALPQQVEYQPGPRIAVGVCA